MLLTSLSVAIDSVVSSAYTVSCPHQGGSKMEKHSIRFYPRRALRAARTLAANPDDLPQVFTIIESLSLDTLARLHARLAKSPSGQKLLAERPDIVDLLADREALRQLPEGSLGRAY